MKLMIISALAPIGVPRSGQKAPSRRHNPAKNSCHGGRGKYPLTIPA
jgi:hypothetical protein